MKKIQYSTLFLILTLAFCLRLYKVNSPVADWHSWRQADTAAVARNFIKDGFNIFYPQSDSLTPLNEYGLQNPNRYFINEFPIFNSLVALVYYNFGVSPAFARLVSITFATLGTLFLFLLTQKLFSFKMAVLTAFFYAVNPYNIYYSRVIMPDPAYIAFSIASLYFFISWVSSKKAPFLVLSSVIFALAILTKPYAVFLFIPMAYWLILNRGFQALKNKQTGIFLAVSLTPLILWRLHVFNHPEGTFASSWLFNAGHIRFTGAYFRWLIFERASRLIFATGTFPLFVFGIIKSHTSKNGSFIFVWLLSVIAYMVIFAKGNVNHDYYQLPLMPVGSILVSLGAMEIYALSPKLYAKVINVLLLLSLFLITLAFGWYEVRGFYNINHPEIVEAGRRADALLPPDALVIAPYNDDPTFLYQTNRHGYSHMPENLGQVIGEGVKYLVSTDTANPQIKTLTGACKVLDQTPNYVIIEIAKECIEK